MASRRRAAAASRGRAAATQVLSIETLGCAGDYGALAHYADPRYYDRTYARREFDVRYYLELAQKHGGRVLEYGAGSGRITIPLARAGQEIVAVDLSGPMLAALEAKLAREDRAVRRRVRLVHGSMCRQRFRSTFDLVLAPFNTVLHLYTQEEMGAFLRRVAAHLGPRGLFAFDYSVPRPGDLDRDPERPYPAASFRDPETGIKVRYRERFEYDPLRQLLVIWMEFLPETGTPWVVPLTHRQYFPCEMRSLLAFGGFKVLRETADFAGREPDGSADSLVLECSCRRAKGRL